MLTYAVGIRVVALAAKAERAAVEARISAQFAAGTAKAVANSGAAIFVSAYCYVYSSQVLLYMCLHTADVGEVANSRLQVSHGTHRLARYADVC